MNVFFLMDRRSATSF